MLTVNNLRRQRFQLINRYVCMYLCLYVCINKSSFGILLDELDGMISQKNRREKRIRMLNVERIKEDRRKRVLEGEGPSAHCFLLMGHDFG
jgi:hypothetical protein